MYPVPDLTPALPELVLAIVAMLLLVAGVSGLAVRNVSRLAVLALLTVAAYFVWKPAAGRVETFGGLFVLDGFAVFMKTLILLGSAFAILVAMRYNERNRIDRFEYPVLILLSVVGMLGMISANDLVSLYVAFELQSLPLYVMAAMKRDTVKSTEAGLKYFVLGALSSGMLLFGASLIYGFGGSTNFDKLAEVLAVPGASQSIGLIIGIVFLSVGLAFKCSAVPFHMWTPDVYEGAPTPVTAFFAVAPKTAALALFLRVMIAPLGHLAPQWEQIIWVISLLSMALGAYAAISQTNIKRLMAYSSIGHVGYALMGLAAGTPSGVEGVLVYMAIYLFMTMGAFTVVLSMERGGQSVESISDLAGLSRTNPLMAASLAIFMFSLAGVPPLAGFFSKIMVFMAAIHAGLYVLATLGVLTSVVGCYYYIRVIKIMYFDEPAPAFDRQAGGIEVKAVMLLTTLVILVLCIVPNVVMGPAAAAAHSLFPG